MKTKKRNARSSWLAAAIALLFHGIPGLSIGNAQDPALHVERFPALTLEEAQAAIELVPGYSVELVASEPRVSSPVGSTALAHSSPNT